MGIVGLYLVSRQWEEYLGTLDVFFGWEGAVLIALALVLVKAAHELGHAYTAVGFGWVNVRRGGTGRHDLLDWPYDVEQPGHRGEP